MKQFFCIAGLFFVLTGCNVFKQENSAIHSDLYTGVEEKKDNKNMAETAAKEDLIEKLQTGFRRFQKLHFSSSDSPYKMLKSGQKPEVLIIACSDSRVDPAILTETNLGDAFVVRNVANLVPPCELENSSYHGVSAAIEYAVLHLKVDAIIVMGHAGCGGIQSLLKEDNHHNKSFIDRWVQIASRAKDIVNRTLPNTSPNVRQRACELLSVQVSLDNLLTFPWVKSAVEESRLKIYGWYFDITTGELLQYDPKEKMFVTLVSSDISQP